MYVPQSRVRSHNDLQRLLEQQGGTINYRPITTGDKKKFSNNCIRLSVVLMGVAVLLLLYQNIMLTMLMLDMKSSFGSAAGGITGMDSALTEYVAQAGAQFDAAVTAAANFNGELFGVLSDIKSCVCNAQK